MKIHSHTATHRGENTNKLKTEECENSGVSFLCQVQKLHFVVVKCSFGLFAQSCVVCSTQWSSCHTESNPVASNKIAARIEIFLELIGILCVFLVTVHLQMIHAFHFLYSLLQQRNISLSTFLNTVLFF